MSRRRGAARHALRRPVRWDPVPKPDGGIRRVVMLDPEDERAFARSVAGAAPFIARAAGSESHANRVLGWDAIHGPVLEPWPRARLRWLVEMRRLGGGARWSAMTDVRACYLSISPVAVAARLRTLGVPRTFVEEISARLWALLDAGIEGLPIGPAVSALLADAVLSAGDDAIRASGASHLRWVDDVAIFAPDRRTGTRALDSLRRCWADLGLELHDGKTRVFSEPAPAAVLGGTRSHAASSALR